MVKQFKTLHPQNFKGLILWGILSPILVSCNHSIDKAMEPSPNSYSDPADLMILNAVASVSENIKKLKAKDSGLVTPKQYPTNPGENKLIDIKWNGPLEPLLHLLGQSYGREVIIMGTPPMTPVLINIRQRGYTLQEIIAAIADHDALPEWVKLTLTPVDINLVYVAN